jgi:hypothetical protein
MRNREHALGLVAPIGVLLLVNASVETAHAYHGTAFPAWIRFREGYLFLSETAYERICRWHRLHAL